MEWDRINFRTEEKKRRYAKLNELTMDELQEFRIQTRKNLGVFFLDQAKNERKDVTNRKSLLNTETQKWEKHESIEPNGMEKLRDKMATGAKSIIPDISDVLSGKVLWKGGH